MRRETSCPVSGVRREGGREGGREKREREKRERETLPVPVETPDQLANSTAEPSVQRKVCAEFSFERPIHAETPFSCSQTERGRRSEEVAGSLSDSFRYTGEERGPHWTRETVRRGGGLTVKPTQATGSG